MALHLLYCAIKWTINVKQVVMLQELPIFGTSALQQFHLLDELCIKEAL